MRIEVQYKRSNKARRLFVPVSEFSVASFPIRISRIFPRCAGAVELQVTSRRQTGTTLTKPRALQRLTGFEIEKSSKRTAAAAALQASPTCFAFEK